MLSICFRKLLFIWLLLAPCYLHGQENPFIEFETTKYELGTIDAATDSIITLRYVFTNTGDAPLAILNVKTTCDCTASKWSHAAVKAGEEGLISIIFRPKGIKGYFERTIFVKSNAINHTVILEVTGKIKHTE